MIELTTENFEREVIKGDSVSCVVFTARWCSFCHSMLRNIELVCHSISDVKFAMVDIDKCKELSAKYNIRSVPATLVFEDGKLRQRRTGLLNKKELFDLLYSKEAKI